VLLMVLHVPVLLLLQVNRPSARLLLLLLLLMVLLPVVVLVQVVTVVATATAAAGPRSMPPYAPRRCARGRRCRCALRMLLVGRQPRVRTPP
jgi:hypothetical protein